MMAYFTKSREDFSAARTVAIVATEQADNVTIYVIEARVGTSTWTIKHRYNDFFELNEKLVLEYKVDKGLLPPKKLFGNQSESFIRKRQSELEVYLQTLFHLLPKIPLQLANFLHFEKYEIHGITHTLAEELFEKGEGILAEERPYQMSPLQLNAISKRLTLPEPTCDSGNAKQDLGHVLDFITRLKYLKIVGNNKIIGQSNMNMNQLSFDLASFKNLQALELTCVNCRMISGIEHLKKMLKRLTVNYSINAVEEFLLLGVGKGVWQATQEESVLIPAWSAIQRANFCNNNITAIDESMKLMPGVEWLDLSRNKLEDIQHLQHLSSLTHVNLSHNRISTLNSLHTKLGNIKTLILHNNKLESLLGFSKLYSLERLDVSSNGISQVLEVRHISGLPCLESLNLSQNPVTIVVDYRTKILELFGDRARELSLDGQKPSQKELDTVAILLAIQKSKEAKAQAKRHVIKKPAKDVEIRERGRRAQNGASNSSQPQSRAAVGQSSGVSGGVSDEHGFRQQVEMIREQGGTAWLALLNHMHESLNNPQPHQPTRPESSRKNDRYPAGELDVNDSSSYGSSSTSSSAEEQEGHGFMLPDTLPGKSDSSFTSHLLKLLPNAQSLLAVSGLVEDRPREERPVHVMWCPIVCYTKPHAEVPVCVFTTTEHLHCLRVRALQGRHGLPDLEHMYCIPLLHIQQIVIGYQRLYLRVEEAFVGPQGTLSLLTASASKTDMFLETLRTAIYRAMPYVDCFEAPHIMVNGEVELSLKAALNKVENLPNLVDVQIVLYMLVQATDMRQHPRVYSTHSLVLTNSNLYIIKEDFVLSPQPTFGIGTSVRPQLTILCSYSVGGRIAGIQMYDADTFTQGADTLPETFMATAASAALSPHFLGFGIKLTFELNSQEQRELDVRFPTSGMRDRFLATLTQVRKELSERSPSPPKAPKSHKSKHKHLHPREAPRAPSSHGSSQSISSVRSAASNSVGDNGASIHDIEDIREAGSDSPAAAAPGEISASISVPAITAPTVTVPVPQDPIAETQDTEDKELNQELHQDLNPELQELSSPHDQYDPLLELDQNENKTDDPIGVSYEDVETHEVPVLGAAASGPIMKAKILPLELQSPVVSIVTPSSTGSGCTLPHIRTQQPNHLGLFYPSMELLDHLSQCNANMPLLVPLGESMLNLASMEGEELLNFFHSQIAQIARNAEELIHVLWCVVTPYHSQKDEIPTCCLLSSRALYFLSDYEIPVGKNAVFSWKKTHHRVKSDSVIGLQQRGVSSQHHSSGILHTGATLSQQGRLKAYATLQLNELKQVNLGMFDQCFRIAGTSPETIYTLLTRDNMLTALFIRRLMMALSWVVPTPSPDVATPGSDVDIYKKFAEAGRLEVQEYTHPSKVKFIYPSEETVLDLQYLLRDSIPTRHAKPAYDMNILLYLLVYVLDEPAGASVSGDCDNVDVSKCKRRTLLVTNSHLGLVIEDHVSYPLPDFAKGLPDTPNFEVVSVRRLEFLRRLKMNDFTSHDLCLVLADETEEIVVDPNLDHYSTSSQDKSPQEIKEISWSFMLQNLRDRERLVKLLRQQWCELHGGDELPVQISS